MVYVPPQDRVLEQSTSNSQTVFTVTGAVDTSFNAFSNSMAVGDTTFGFVVEPGVAFKSGILTYSNTNEVTIDSTSGESKGTFSSSGTKEVGMGLIASRYNSLSPSEANLVINGGMEVSQATGTTAQVGAAAVGAMVADMYSYAKNGSHVVTVQQVTDAPPGFKYSFKVTVTTANASPGADNYALITCGMEGYRGARLGFGAAGAQSFSRGLWVKAHRPGTYSIAFVPASFDRSYVTTFTVNAADTWEYKTFVIPGDTAGTWNTTDGAFFYFYVTLMAGTNYQQTAGSWASPAAHGWAYGATGTINGVAATSDTFQITGDSIVPGTVPVPQEMSPFIVPPFDQALADCRRYYRKSFKYATAPATNVGEGTGETVFSARVAGAAVNRSDSWVISPPMRAAPTFTLYNPAAANAQVRDSTAAADCSASAIAGEENEVHIVATGAAGTAIGNKLVAHWTADARL